VVSATQKKKERGYFPIGLSSEIQLEASKRRSERMKNIFVQSMNSLTKNDLKYRNSS